MNKALLGIVLVALVGLAGCAGFSGADQSPTDETVDIENESAGATNVTQRINVEVTETTAGEELSEVGATYPRDRFVVDAAQHEDVTLGVDTNGDGAFDESFTGTNISGVNNNAYSFDITLETDYTLRSGDVVGVEYPDVDNPTEPGEYTVETHLNGRQTSNATVTVE